MSLCGVTTNTMHPKLKETCSPLSCLPKESCVWMLCVLAVVIVVCPTTAYYNNNNYNNNNNIGPGRHVCVTGHTSQTPVKSVQTYYKPVYKKHMRMCDNSPYRLCSSFRVAYELAYRDVYTMRPRSQVIYACCPGWTQSRLPQNGCMEPVCAPPCQHGGRCVRPARCKCQPGWTGSTCSADVDECSSGRHRCEHRCVNTPGSYRCSCHHGFNPVPTDARRCQLCLTCLPQYQEQDAKYHSLVFRIETIEQEKIEMQQKIAVLEQTKNEQFATIKDMVETIIADHFTTTAGTPVTKDVVTSLPATTTDDSTMQTQTEVIEKETTKEKDGHLTIRMRSLTRQIAFLEERLGLCECNRR